jgi:anti-anti-sigma regulatory factor
VSGEERWYVVEGRPALDPVTGERALLMHLFDDTARRGAENLAEAKGLLVEELRQTVGLVERQRRKILELSAPILHIGRGALAVPVIGVIDDARVEELGIRLLPAVVEHGSSSVVLDLTGANALEKQGLDRLSCLVRSLQLLGTRTVLTGIRPGLAKTLVERHHEFVEAKILRSLAEGIDECRATAPVLG